MERSCAGSQNGDKHERYGPNPAGTATLPTMKEPTMLNRTKKAAIAIALASATAATGLAYAQSQAPATGETPTTQAAQPGTAGAQANWLNIGQIYDKLQAAGYTDVREIEREDRGYEAKARNADGRTVKLQIDPVDGKIVGEKVRSREGKRDRDEKRDRDHRPDQSRG